jgi:glucose-6-phosphate 1-dehydrogenase
MYGNGVLFGREDIVDARWRIVQPILDAATPHYAYQPGSWGPDEASQLIGGNGPWRDPTMTRQAAKLPSR